MQPARPAVAVGPTAPGWGSWDWVGVSLLEGLGPDYTTAPFAPWDVPTADVVVVVKHPPPAGWAAEVARRSALVYCPVDHYGGPAEVAADADWLRLCNRIVVHARRLEGYFRPLAETVYLDHPLKYVTPTRRHFRADGPLLWVGVRTNLPPLADWVNAHPLPAPLDVLTNPERPGAPLPAAAFGFRPDREVRVREWTPALHLDLLAAARAALDVKGHDFRSRHKPPAKALDYVASGVPVALTAGASAEHLAGLGLAVPSPLDADRWLSREYWEETRRLGEALTRDLSPGRVAARARGVVEAALRDRPAGRPTAGEPGPTGWPEPAAPPPGGPVRVAVLSLLFNWPSTGGGNIHTAELTKFLAAAGYEVRHLYARFTLWGLGQVTEPTPHPAEPLKFTPDEWNAAGIQNRFGDAVRTFDPDHVIITDSWNFKPLLADAVAGYRYSLRLQALECLCPLNNLRLLPTAGGPPAQCHRHQLATPDDCAGCVRDHGRFSGDLHRAERELSGVGTPLYREALFRAFAGAEAVLVVNPPSADMVRPYARDVRVVTAGMDPTRFPWPPPDAGPRAGPVRILFAGLAREWGKGFHVLRAAGAALWAGRVDFELVVTDDPPGGAAEPFARYLGWQSQADLVGHLYAADIVVLPVVGQEALGRTAVEAMAAGRPVVASRLGGLPFTVTDGVTGLLVEPGDAEDLARKLETLVADPGMRAEFGTAGRRRFEREYSWPVVVDTHYRPLLGGREGVRSGRREGPAVGCVLAVRDRPVTLVERTLRSYAWQTHAPADRVLLDYGSDAAHAAAYAALGGRYGWRLVRVEAAGLPWSSAAAYNLAAAALSAHVEVLFKSDADVLLGDGVLAAAARLGAEAFCKFQYLVAPGPPAPAVAPAGPAALLDAVCGDGPPEVGSGCGLFACPAAWFRAVGGFDLAFQGWGYEDPDLAARAELALPVVEVPWRDGLLVHQWHPPAADARRGLENRAYYRYMRLARALVRNGGRLAPVAPADPAPRPAFDALRDTLRRTVVVLAAHDPGESLSRWRAAWQVVDRGEARLVVVSDRGPADGDADHLARPVGGSDAAVFEAVVSGRLGPLPADWEYLFWAAADTVPLRQDFLLHYLHAAADPEVGMVVRWGAARPPTGRPPAEQVTSVLFRRAAARGLRFSPPPPGGRGLGPAPGGLAAQILGLGFRVTAVGGPADRVMWDTGDEREAEAAPLFAERFGSPLGPAGS